MPQVGIDHEHVVAAHAGDLAAALGANMDRHVLAEILLLPISRRVGWPLYLRSCGGPPKTQ